MIHLEPPTEILRNIRRGAEELQNLVDAFNGLGLSGVESDEFLFLVADPRGLFDEKAEKAAKEMKEAAKEAEKKAEKTEKELEETAKKAEDTKEKTKDAAEKLAKKKEEDGCRRKQTAK